jgi:hypothetical protein
MQPQCPQCGKDFVRRSHRQGILEWLLSVVFVYPFRCQLCTHRFLAMQWGVRYRKESVDQRQYDRVAVRLPAACRGERSGGKGVVTDISMRGCMLETDVQLVEGGLIEMSFQPSDLGQPVTVETAVVRSARSGSVGLEFLCLQPNEKEALRQLMMGLLADQRT